MYPRGRPAPASLVPVAVLRLPGHRSARKDRPRYILLHDDKSEYQQPVHIHWLYTSTPNDPRHRTGVRVHTVTDADSTLCCVNRVDVIPPISEEELSELPECVLCERPVRRA